MQQQAERLLWYHSFYRMVERLGPEWPSGYHACCSPIQAVGSSLSVRSESVVASAYDSIFLLRCKS